MLETVSSWLSPFVHWLSQWMPHWVASILVYGVPCILIGIPLSEGWAILRRRWWNRLGHNESRLFLLLAFGAALLYSRGHVTMDANQKLTGLLMLAGAAGVVAYSIIVRSIRMPIASGRWETRAETAPGFPVITWRQDVDTGLQQKHVRNSIELKLLMGWIIGCVALGWIWGGLGGAVGGLFVAGFFAPAFNRESTPPKPENVGGFVPMPGKWSERPPTELERKIDAEPVIESWEAQAFISSSAGADFIVAEPHFVVQWRNIITGEEPMNVFYPWSEMSPFEMDSSEKLFGYRDRPTQYKDPWVITVRTKDGVPLEVARDMTGQAKLQAVFFTLSRHFGVERRAAFFLERAAERKRRGLDQPIVEEAPVTADGIRLRPQI